MIRCTVGGLEESIMNLTADYRTIDEMNQGTPAFIVNAGYAVAKRAFDSVQMDGPDDVRPEVTRIKYGYADWGMEISGEYRQIKWFEYGTGIAGLSASHPRASADGYVYDKNKHGEDGWSYTGGDGEKVQTRGIVGCRGIYKAQLAMEEALARPSRRRLK